MAFVTLAIPPGIYRTGTDYKSKGRWLNANLWRWFSGESRPVGGWVLRSRSDDGGLGGGDAASIEGKARAIITWKDKLSRSWAAIGTHSGLYAMTPGGFTYDITPSGLTEGNESASSGGAYGSGFYGGGIYGFGEPTDAVTKEASVWSLDTYGENLIACMAEDGKIYEWEPDVSAVAVQITDSPEGVRAVVVTSERIVMALGTESSPRLVKWSDKEDNTDWNSTATNYAGEFPLQTVGRLMCGQRVAGGTLLLTDVDAWFASFLGQPLVYGFQKVGSQCGIVSQGAIVATDVQAFWMSHNGFWRFNGYSEPLPCEVHDYVFSDINVTQASKITAVHISDFREIWWLYPSAESSEIDRYVVYNYGENHWNIGALVRYCGVDRGAFKYVMMVDATGNVYDHERDFAHDGFPVFCESGPVEIEEGDFSVMVRRIIPDEQSLGECTITFYARFYPMGSETTHGPYSLTAYTDTRFTARQARVRFNGSGSSDFRVGNFRLDVVPAGKR